MKHTIAECILITQTFLISCHARYAIIMDTSVANGDTQLIQPNQDPHVVSVNFSLPNYPEGAAVTLPDGRAYFLGGTSSGRKSTVTRFDPTTNTSTSVTPMNTARSYFGATVIGNQIVVCGGKCIDEHILHIYQS